MGNIGDHGIFLGITGKGWWLLGLNVTNGQRTFAPVQLGSAGDATDFKCFVNGPPMVLCVRQGPDLMAPSTAWVVDTSSGRLIFDGPTDLRVSGVQDQPHLEQIGDYATAGVEGKGMYGVGPRAELTWFVPGNGILAAQFATWERDTTPSILAVQGSGAVADVVFSVDDGKVVKPSVPQGVQLGHAIVYTGGFAYEYTTVGDPTDRVAFFDEMGSELGDAESDGTLVTGSVDLPIVGSKTHDRIFTPDGRRLLELPPSLVSPNARLIGSQFFVATDADHRRWQQFDLRTGQAGKTCDGDYLGFYYIGSDGEVAVALGGDGPARGVDLATCGTLWSLPSPTASEAKEVWRVNGTLVQRTDDRLFSLIAPS